MPDTEQQKLRTNDLNLMQITAQELCNYLNGTLEGDPHVVISRPSKIEECTEGSVSFIASPKYYEYVYTTEASALLVEKNFECKKPVKPTLIRVEDVYSCVSLLLEKFGNLIHGNQGVSDLAFIAKSAVIDPSVSIGASSHISEQVKIGAGSIIFSQVFIGENVQLGENVTLHPGVRIYQDCVIGDNVVIHSNTVIGSDGFGFAPQPDGTFKKVPQIGNVEIGHNVEIGSNCSIDRATMGSTVIQDGVKLDNLIQIAHNVVIGANTVIAAQTGIAGSTKIGRNCMIGGQVGIVGHITIADGTRIQAQSGVGRSIKTPKTSISGSPAFDYTSELKSQVLFRKLPQMEKRLQELEALLRKKEN